MSQRPRAAGPLRRARFPGAGSQGPVGHQRIVPGRDTGTVFPQAGAHAVRAGHQPGGKRAARAAAVRPAQRRHGYHQRRSGCPGGVGQPEVRTGTGLCAVAVMRVKTVPPAGPRAPGWTGHSRRQPCLWLRSGRAIPSPSARRGLADHSRPVQVVRPAGRSTCTGREWPAPRGVADGDGMTRPGQECAYAPRKNHPESTRERTP